VFKPGFEALASLRLPGYLKLTEMGMPLLCRATAEEGGRLNQLAGVGCPWKEQEKHHVPSRLLGAQEERILW